MVQQDLDAELEEEETKRLDKEESKRKGKALLFFALPLLVTFLIFIHYFLKNVEEKHIVAISGNPTVVVNGMTHTSKDKK